MDINHATELLRHAEKIGRPAGDTPAVMRAAAAHIEALERKLAEIKRRTYVAVTCNHVGRMERAEARVAELEAERAEREAGKLLAYLSNDRTQFFIPSMEGKDVKHAPYMAHWMAGWTPLYAAPPVTAPAVGYVNALRYIAWTAAGYMDCVHAAKQAIGETGALPPPPKIQPARGEG